MTLDDVLELVQGVSDSQGDPEMAHSREDDMYRAVLTAIADGALNARELARAALETSTMAFPRWCA